MIRPNGDREGADHERDAGAEHGPAEDVVAVAVGAEPPGALGRAGQAPLRVGPEGPDRRPLDLERGALDVGAAHQRVRVLAAGVLHVRQPVGADRGEDDEEQPADGQPLRDPAPPLDLRASGRPGRSGRRRRPRPPRAVSASTNSVSSAMVASSSQGSRMADRGRSTRRPGRRRSSRTRTRGRGSPRRTARSGTPAGRCSPPRPGPCR